MTFIITFLSRETACTDSLNTKSVAKLFFSIGTRSNTKRTLLDIIVHRFSLNKMLKIASYSEYGGQKTKNKKLNRQPNYKLSNLATTLLNWQHPMTRVFSLCEVSEGNVFSTLYILVSLFQEFVSQLNTLLCCEKMLCLANLFFFSVVYAVHNISHNVLRPVY